jgi:hypothetical protein
VNKEGSQGGGNMQQMLADVVGINLQQSFVLNYICCSFQSFKLFETQVWVIVCGGFSLRVVVVVVVALQCLLILDLTFRNF